MEFGTLHNLNDKKFHYLHLLRNNCSILWNCIYHSHISHRYKIVYLSLQVDANVKDINKCHVFKPVDKRDVYVIEIARVLK